MKTKAFLIFLVSLFCNFGFGQGSGNCLVLDGQNDYIITNNVLTTVQLDEITISGWVYPQATTTFHTIFAVNEDNPFIDNNVNLFYYKGDSQQFVYFDKDPTHFNIPLPGTFPRNHWYHFALVFSDNGKVNFFINGVNVFELDAFDMPKNRDRLSFGQDWDGNATSAHFFGKMDELRIWNTAKSQQFIRDNMCRKLNGIENNLIAHYTFEDVVGTTINDQSSYGYNGLIVNSNSAIQLSSAPIGDESTYAYGASLDVNIEGGGDSVFVNRVVGNPDGIHLYYVAETPNSILGLTNNPIPAKYFGVFATNLSARYNLEYHYADCNGLGCNEYFDLRSRNDNAVLNWESVSPIFNNIDCFSSALNESNVGAEVFRGEYISSVDFATQQIQGISDTLLCTDGTLQMTIPSNVSATNIVWNDTQAADTFFITQPGVYFVSFDVGVCSYRDTFNVAQISPPLVPILDEDITFCTFEPHSITVNEAVFPSPYYLWNGIIGSSNFIAENVGLQTIELNFYGCILTDSIVLGQLIQPQLPNLDTVICKGKSLDLGVKGDSIQSILWFDGQTTQNITLLEPTDVSLIVTMLNGCVYEISGTVEGLDVPFIELGIDTFLCPNTSIVITPKFGFVSSFIFDSQFFDSNFDLIIDSPGNYTAFVQNQCGIARDDINILDDSCRDFYIPNIFSPNGDGINELFELYSNGDIKVIKQCLIFDRWGELVYKAENLAGSNTITLWDGNYRKQNLGSAVFTYFIEVVWVDDVSDIIKGDVTIVR